MHAYRAHITTNTADKYTHTDTHRSTHTFVIVHTDIY